jgi:hypothetical protein
MALDAGADAVFSDGENKRMPDFGPDFGRTFPRTPEAIPGTDCAALRYETKSPRPAPGAHAQKSRVQLTG